MKRIAHRYRFYLKDKAFCVSTALSILFLIGATVLNFYLSTYATKEASNSVTDFILSNIPTFDVDGLFVYGSLVLILFIALLCFIHPKRLPFTVKSLALFIAIRAVFVSLTHIGPFPSQIPLDLGTITNKFIFGGDLFFSGHTGIPFLMALIYWREKVLRYTFLIWSVFFGTTALMGHLHYSIDVLSAFFITYTIFHISMWLFPKDQTTFLSEHTN